MIYQVGKLRLDEESFSVQISLQSISTCQGIPVDRECHSFTWSG